MTHVTTATAEGVKEFREKFPPVKYKVTINGGKYIQMPMEAHQYITEREQVETFLTHFAQKIALAALQDAEECSNSCLRQSHENIAKLKEGV